jgi:hypothetical protein
LVFSVIFPLSAGTIPKIALAIVLFPLPLSPTRDTISPPFTWKLTPLTAGK